MRINAIDGFTEDMERLRGALEASCVVGTWDWDHTRGVVSYDAGAARLLTGDPDLAEREITGVSAAAAIHPEDREWLAEHMRKAASVGGLVLSEYRVIAPDGSVCWLLSRGRTYQDHFGRPLRSCGILIDITEMRNGGERYVMGSAPQAEALLDRAADLAITLKQTLGSGAPAEVQAAATTLLYSLGYAIARAKGR
ncbi:PAS domain-containing protein [Methylobacterium sp. J-077]|uniref:PAS domain-containing protein n=1 Tax=Methylobacterium sp. J-077 TaxID=2836656 RepID=UPI001FB926B3|nr:PAS domain-containing protein [Methylobacterium sp. J-077]MCJ2124936.1 PAS domain-containing protein [Methylobacterium sp. J-077]